MEAGGTRRILCAFVAILILFAVLIPQTFRQADAATDGRYVSIVLDDSGSMSDEPNRWQNALYALEVFAGMLGNNDTLVLQTLNRSNDVLTVDGSDLQSCMQAVDAWVARQRAGGNTLFESVPASAYREVRKVTASEKWVIHLTDGEYNDISDYKARFLSETSACDCKTVFLGLSLSKVAQNKYAAPNDSELIESLKKQDFYVYYADNANETIGKVREIAQLVFENYELCHDSLRMSGSTLTFDLAMPVEEMIILVQGNGLSMGTLVYQGTEVSGECCQICVGTTSGCIGKFRGQLRSGVYSIDFGKSPVDYRVYVRPYLDIGIQFRNDQGELLRSNPKVLSKGTYTYEIGLIDPYDKSIIEENAQTAGIYADISSTIVQNGVEEIGKRQGTLELQEGSVHVDAKAYLPPSNKEINTGNGIDIVIVSDNAIQPIIHIYDDAGSEVEDRADLDTGTYSYDVELTTAMTGEARETLLHSAVVDVDIEQDGVTTKGASAGTIQVGTETMAITATATVEGAVAGSAVRRLSAVGDLALTFTDYEDTWPAEGIETQAITLRATLDGQALTEKQRASFTPTVTCSNRALAVKVERGTDDSSWIVRVEQVTEDPYDIYSGQMKFTAGGDMTLEGKTIRATACEAVVDVPNMPFRVWLARNWWWLLAIAIVLLIIIIWLRSKAMPRHVKQRETVFNIGGREIDSNASVKYNKRSLQISAPSLEGLYPQVSCACSMKIAKVDPRIRPSKKRRILVESISAGSDISSVSVGAATYERDTQGNLVKEASTRTLIANGATIEISGVAFDNNGRRRTAILEVTLRFK